MALSYKVIFENNKKWVEKKLGEDADFFKNLAKEQNPEYLYIGCSDSRVTTEELMGLKPGEVFVHRNIANLVNTLDLNAISAIQYAVEHLKVKHIIVCGHYDCGGIKAAMSPEDLGNNRLVELNVQEQCINVIKLACVQERYIVDEYPIVHGWVFDISTGKLKDLNLDFKNILKDIQEIYNLTDSEWVMSRKHNKNIKNA